MLQQEERSQTMPPKAILHLEVPHQREELTTCGQPLRNTTLPRDPNRFTGVVKGTPARTPARIPPVDPGSTGARSSSPCRGPVKHRAPATGVRAPVARGAPGCPGARHTPVTGPQRSRETRVAAPRPDPGGPGPRRGRLLTCDHQQT